MLAVLRFLYGLSVFATGQASVQLWHLPLFYQAGQGIFLGRTLPPHFRGRTFLDSKHLLPTGQLHLQLFLPASDQIRQADHVTLNGFSLSHLFDAPCLLFLVTGC